MNSNELIKYILNPTPNPRIYREIGDDFIKNYGVTVIIGNSCLCFSPLSIQHSWSTIQILLHNLGSIDLPCFDLIVDILSEKSQIWLFLFDLLYNNIKNTDWALVIRVVYNLHNARKFLLPDFLFVITGVLFSKSEINRIVENVNFYLVKGINIFGIDVGVSPFGIEQWLVPIPNYY